MKKILNPKDSHIHFSLFLFPLVFHLAANTNTNNVPLNSPQEIRH